MELVYAFPGTLITSRWFAPTRDKGRPILSHLCACESLQHVAPQPIVRGLLGALRALGPRQPTTRELPIAPYLDFLVSYFLRGVLKNQQEAVSMPEQVQFIHKPNLPSTRPLFHISKELRKALGDTPRSTGIPLMQIGWRFFRVWKGSRLIGF